MKMSNILWDGEAGGGGGGTPPVSDWRLSIPEDIRNDPTLKAVPDVSTLAKNYVHAARMVGDRIPTPRDTWTENEWNDFYNKAGRPGKPEEYGLPSVKPNEGIELDKEKIARAFGEFHKAGLSKRQAEAVMAYYIGTLNDIDTNVKQSYESKKTESVTALKTQYGAGYDSKIALAKVALKNYAPPEFLSKLEHAGLGDDPDIIRTFIKIGESMGEDDATRGAGYQNLGLTPEAASAEIGKMKADETFMKALMNAESPGHKEAVERWTALHASAIPK